MSVNTRGIDNSFDRKGGLVWNWLHSERENICEALLKEYRTGIEPQPGLERMSKAKATVTEQWHRELLQTRLNEIDDALDRLMKRSYDDCNKPEVDLGREA